MTSTDPQFLRNIRAYYPFLIGDPSLSKMMPLMVLVRNDGSVPINAYSIKWVVTREGGSEYHFSTRIVGPTSENTPLYGGEPVILPNEIILVSPYFHWSNASSPKRLSRSRVQLSRFETDPRVQDVVKGASVKIEIDSAICGEALCGGIDSEEFLKRYQHTREAQREVANSVCVLFLQNSPAETMDASLSKRSKLPASTDVVEDRPYAIEAAKTAGLLLVALRQGGVANLQEVVSRICSCDPEKAGRVS